MIALVAIPGVLGLIAGAVFLEAFIVMIVWGAIAGQFEGAPTISLWLSMAVAAGLSIVGGAIGRSN